MNQYQCATAEKEIRDLSNSESVNLHSVKLFGRDLNVTESYLKSRTEASDYKCHVNKSLIGTTSVCDNQI